MQLCGYSTPTPVQKHSMAIVSAGRDLMACAQTGSGKTAAFLMPILSCCFNDGPESNAYDPSSDSRYKAFPKVLILAPTRELALQIFEESRKVRLFCLHFNSSFVTALGCVLALFMEVLI